MSRNTGEAADGARSSRIRLSGSRPGPITTALRGSVAEAREEGRITGPAVVWAALADRVAMTLDAAYRADDLGAVLRSTRELRELVDLLPLRERAGDPAGEAEGGTRDGGTPRGRVLELLDSPPALGN